MLVLMFPALWSVIAIASALLAGETLRRLGPAMPDRRHVVLAVRADRMRRHDNVTRGVR